MNVCGSYFNYCFLKSKILSETGYVSYLVLNTIRAFWKSSGRAGNNQILRDDIASAYKWKTGRSSTLTGRGSTEWGALFSEAASVPHM